MYARTRLLQLLAFYAPGGSSVRVWLHRRRGVTVGDGTWIGVDALIDPGYPERVEIGRRVSIGIRSTILGHFAYKGVDRTTLEKVDDAISVRIEDDAYIGPGAIVLHDVTIGHGAVVAAGSVVTRSVPPLTMVQGNPARPVAKCGIPLGVRTPLEDFCRELQPL